MTATTAEAADEQRRADSEANLVIMARMAAALRGTAHNVTGLVPVLCQHGALLVVDPDEAGGWLVQARDPAAPTEPIPPLADGRVVVRPRSGATFVRSKYATSTFMCVVDQGQPRPADLTTPGAFRPVAGVCTKPVRLWVPEVYDPQVHR